MKSMHFWMVTKLILKILFLFHIQIVVGRDADQFDEDALSHIGAKRTCIESTSRYCDQRCFYTYIPECAGENSPLVFDIHG